MEKYLTVLSSLTPSGNTKHGGADTTGMSNTMSMTLTPSSSYDTSTRGSPSRANPSGILGGMFDKRSSRLVGRGAAADHNKGMTHFTMTHSSGLMFSAKSPRGN